jgi:hypothetical protein
VLARAEAKVPRVNGRWIACPRAGGAIRNPSREADLAKLVEKPPGRLKLATGRCWDGDRAYWERD